MIGLKISPILEELEDVLLDFEASSKGVPCFTKNGFRASIKIFMSTLMEKMWEHQQIHNMPIEQRETQAEELGKKLRALVLEYTGIDTHTLYD